MTPEFVIELVMRWRAEADRLERLGQPGAMLAREYAEELERVAREWELEALTLEAAVNESGYSYSALQKKISNGELPNVGERGKPRIRRCDLPLKAPYRVTRRENGEPDLAGELLTSRLAGP